MKSLTSCSVDRRTNYNVSAEGGWGRPHLFVDVIPHNMTSPQLVPVKAEHWWATITILYITRQANMEVSLKTSKHGDQSSNFHSENPSCISDNLSKVSSSSSADGPERTSASMFFWEMWGCVQCYKREKWLTFSIKSKRPPPPWPRTCPTRSDARDARCPSSKRLKILEDFLFPFDVSASSSDDSASLEDSLRAFALCAFLLAACAFQPCFSLSVRRRPFAKCLLSKPWYMFLLIQVETMWSLTMETVVASL